MPDQRPSSLEIIRLKSELFSGIDPTLLRQWLDDCSTLECEVSDVLISQGTIPESLYLLIEGELDVHITPEQSTSFATLKPGNLAGEVSLLSGREASAWVSTKRPSKVIRISGAQLLQWAQDSHQFALNLLQLANTRLHESNTVARSTQNTAAALHAKALTDSLTGLLNRHWLESNRSRFHGISLVAIDIDHFKQINDHHGHPTGDLVLKAVAEEIRLATRPHDTVLRLGGEEFAVIIDLSRSDATPKQLAERLRAAVAQLQVEVFGSQEQPLCLQVHISLGVATQKPGEPWEELMGRADKALYAAKQGGRNRVEVADLDSN